MNSFVIDVDMSMNSEVIDEAVAKEVKGVECFCCQRSNVPLLLHEEDNVLICDGCLDEMKYSYYDYDFNGVEN